MTRDEPSPRSIRLMTALLLVATFAAGTVTGAGVYRWAAWGHAHPPMPPPMSAPLPLEQLGLSEEQREKARQILERHRPELEAVLRETFPRMRGIGEQIEREIREILTPEQRARLDELKSRWPPGPPGMPGPHPPGAPPGPWGPTGHPPPFGPPPPPPP
jgi:Spy/CpxP family protein refolding chaperone